MRNQWRLLHLLLRNHHKVPNQSQVLRSLSSIPLRFTTNQSKFPINPSFRNFSSEPVLANVDPDHSLIVDIFSKSRDLNDVKNQLDSNQLSINHEVAHAVLRMTGSDLDLARRFFQWVLENYPERLSSKSYNQFLGVLGINGAVEEFWDLVRVMKKKGFGVSKWVKDKTLDYFEKNGMNGDALKLKELFDNDTVERKFTNLCRIVRNNVWSDDVEKEIRDLNVGFSSELVKLVLENLGSDPNKALIFFRWVEESGVFNHDGCTYNAMARVLGREDSIDRFWKLVGDMRSAGFEMEVETFVKVLGRFCKRKMIKDAVELYEFAMAGADKPSPPCFTFLLRKVVSSKELDMGLFSRVVKVFTRNGNALTDSMADAVLKSLTSVGKIGEWNKVLKEMEDSGFVASGSLRNKIAFRLGATGNKEQANEFVNRIEAYGSHPDHKMWQSLVEGHCVGGNLDKAIDSFKEMVEKEGVEYAGYTFELLMNSYCQMKRAKDACKILCQWVNEKELKPRHSTYKLLVTNLLAQGGFTDALNILPYMRNHGFPPFTEPLIEHISKRGSGDDAVLLLEAMTSKDISSKRRTVDEVLLLLKANRNSKKFPSASVYHELFNAFFKQGRHGEAQNFLSKCPSHIRNDADVLELFCSMNSKEASDSGLLAA